MPPPLKRDDLLTHTVDGLSTARAPRVGLEYERLGVLQETGEALPYDGPRSVVTVLRGLAAAHGWRPVGDGPLLELEQDGTRLTLEPGAQLEISARPHVGLVDAGQEIAAFLAQLADVSRPLGIRWLPLGLHPVSTPDEIRRIPKERYEIMARYLPTRGRLALWMMKATAGMQVNLDARGPEDAMALLRLSLMATSAVTALFANSPLSAGRENGWASRRARIWLEVDPDRCGLPEALSRPGAGIDDYVDWALDAGMFFIEREGRLVDMTGTSFRGFLDAPTGDHQPTLRDWELHLTTLFPEARLKSYIELRSGDSSRFEHLMAYAALWKGLIYGDADVRAAATDLTSGWSRAERLAFHEDAARRGLAAVAPDGRKASDLARRLVDLADAALAAADDRESALLDPARRLLDAGRSPADEVLSLWRGAWAGSAANAAVALDP